MRSGIPTSRCNHDRGPRMVQLGLRFDVHRQISDGTVVMNERTDVIRRKDGGNIPLPVMGVFELMLSIAFAHSGDLQIEVIRQD